MIYSQNDPRWANIPLGFGGTTIGKAGCFVTFFSDVCKKAGYDIDPNAMNNAMKKHGWFVNSCDVAEHKVPALLFGNIEWVGEVHWDGAADLSFFDDAADPHVMTGAMIDASQVQAGLQTHFTMVNRREGNDLIIDDTWDGKQKSITWYGADAAALVRAAYKFKLKSIAKESEDMITEENYEEVKPWLRVVFSLVGGAPLEATMRGDYDQLLHDTYLNHSIFELIRNSWLSDTAQQYRAERENAIARIAQLKTELEAAKTDAPQPILVKIGETLAAISAVDAQQTEILKKIVNKETE